MPSTRSSSAGIAGPGSGGTTIASAPARPIASRYFIPSTISRRGGSASGVATSNGLWRISDVVTAISGMGPALWLLRTETLTGVSIGTKSQWHAGHLSKHATFAYDAAYRHRPRGERRWADLGPRVGRGR